MPDSSASERMNTITLSQIYRPKQKFRNWLKVNRLEKETYFEYINFIKGEE